MKVFSFTVSERKGILFLVLMILILGIIQLYLKLAEPSRIPTAEELQAIGDISSFEQGITTEPDSTWTEKGKGFAGELFSFNPNTITVSDMKRLGLGNSLIRTIQKYRNKGGRFYRKEDLLKIYGMYDALYDRLAPYIKIENITKPASPREVFVEDRSAIININIADSVLLETLPGIGPVLARRIVNYRKILGGFYSKEQLREVYGITDSTVERILPRLFIDTAYVHKININETSEAELSKHPYIGRHTARGIVRYRLEVKKIKNLNELVNNGLISSDMFAKAEKYLTI